MFVCQLSALSLASIPLSVARITHCGEYGFYYLSRLSARFFGTGAPKFVCLLEYLCTGTRRRLASFIGHQIRGECCGTNIQTR
jgi:hypothetical protein